MNCFSFKKNKKKQHKANSAPELSKQNTANTSNNKRVSKSGNSVSASKSIPELYKERQHNLRVFTYEELSEATNGFNKLLRIGEGGFGSVFKGTINTPNKGIPNPTVVAIKKLNRYGLQVIFRDFKSSNILLDENMNAKLSDFGMAREGPTGDNTHVSTRPVGTYGYAAPEYVDTGHLKEKSDIYSFGVVLYEILTGRRSIDRDRPPGEQKLLDWVKRFPADSRMFNMIMDFHLRNQYPLNTARKIAKLADRCLIKDETERPDMSEIIEVFKGAVLKSEEKASRVNIPKSARAK